jgi:hypothetical protein
VNFRPLALFTAALAVLAAAIALPLLWRQWPTNAAVVGGLLSWPAAVCVAWLGQKWQRRR